MTQYTVSL